MNLQEDPWQWHLKRQPLIEWGRDRHRNNSSTTPLRQSNRLNLNTPRGKVVACALTPESRQKRTSSSISHAEKISDNNSSQEVPHSSMAGSTQSGFSKKLLARRDLPRILTRKIDEEMYRSIWARRPSTMTNQENEEERSVNPYRSVPRRSNRKDKQGSYRRQPHSFIKQDRNGVCEDEISNKKQEQECCRTLQFDDYKGISDDDFTQSLDMMDMTAMISGASVFQDPKRCQRTENPQSRRKVNFSDRTSRYENRVEKREIFNNCFEDIKNHSQCDKEVTSNSNCILPKKTVLSRIPPPKIKINETITAENVGKQTNISRIHKRRSAIPTFKVTPKYKIKRDSRSKSTSKLTIPLQLHQKDSVQSSSKYGTRCSTRNISRRSAVAVIPKIVIETVGEDLKPSQVDIAVTTDPVEKCDAATNTSMQYGESLKSDLVREVQKLNEEMDEIKRKADLICEQTVARRKRMKESHALENYLTTISPMKRIRAMLEENDASHIAHEDASCARVSSVSETNMASYRSTESLCLDNCDMDLTNPNITTVGDSPMDQSIFNTTGDMNISHSKWKHLRLNSRVFQTPSSHPLKREIQLTSPPEVEHFSEINEDEVSPFTEMAGDCERPSLAPMTPHSHKQVSLLKLSLRKQLDQLFE